MTVTSLQKDFDNLAITLVADFDAAIEQVWQLWADPRQLERWWGPPTYPATMEQHDLTPGAEVTWFMTSPEGERHRGWWRITSVDPPNALEFVDGFADADGTPSVDTPTTRVEVRLTRRGTGTRMELRASFESREQMQQLLDTGMAEGLQQSVGQMDALLAG